MCADFVIHDACCVDIAKSSNAALRQLFRCLCYALLVPVTRKECDEGRCAPHETETSMPNFSNAAAGEVLLDQAIRYFEAAEKRHKDVKEKGKTILALSVFVASFITFTAGFTDRGLLLLLPAMFTLVTVLFFLEMFRLSWSAFPKMDQEFVDAEDQERRKLLAQNYVRAARFGNSRTDYVATVLVAARRSSALALLSVVVVIVVYASSGRRSTGSDLVRSLRSDPSLLQLLRGPKGDVGATGPAGSVGQRGPRGEDGTPGTPGAGGNKKSHQLPAHLSDSAADTLTP